MASQQILLDGNFTRGLFVNSPVIRYPFQVNNDKTAITIDRQYRVRGSTWIPGQVGVDRDPRFSDAYLMAEPEPTPTGISDLVAMRRTYARIPGSQVTPTSLQISKPSLSGTFPQVFGTYRLFQPDTTLLKYDAYAAQTVTGDTGAPSGFYPTGGTYTLTFGGSTTGAIAWNASSATVQTALNALTPISDRGGVTVTGTHNTAGGLVVTFNSYTAATADVSSLTGFDDSSSTSSISSTNGGYTQSISLLRAGGAVATGSADVSALTVPTGATAASAFSLTNNGRTQAVTLSASGIGSATSSINTSSITYSGTLSSEFSQSGASFTLRITSSGPFGGASGSFTLTAFGSTTGALGLTTPGNLTSGEETLRGVLGALNALSGVSAVGVFSGYVVAYSGDASTVSDMRMALTFTPKFTGGTYTLTMFGQTTSSIAYNASTTTIQTALNALSEVATDRGGATVTGAGLSSDGTTITFTITLPAAQFTGGTFTVTMFGQTTSAIAYNATPLTIQSALNALSEVQTKRGGVVVGGIGLNAGLTAINFTIEFANATFTSSATSLTTAPCSITVTPSTAPAGKVQTITFAAAAVTRTVFCANHGITTSDTLYLKTGSTYYTDISGTFTIPDENTITLTIAASASYAAAGTFSEVGKRTKRNYTPGVASIRAKNTQTFYLPGITPGIATADDIPIPENQSDSTPFLLAAFAGTGTINYLVGQLERWNGWPILSLTTTTIKASDV